MNYEMPVEVKKMLNEGECLGHACYYFEDAALCQYAAERLSIRYEFHQSDSPTGKDIFLFFFYPNTYRKAFELGKMLTDPLWRNDNENKFVEIWRNTFAQLPNKYIRTQ